MEKKSQLVWTKIRQIETKLIYICKDTHAIYLLTHSFTRNTLKANKSKTKQNKKLNEKNSNERHRRVILKSNSSPYIVVHFTTLLLFVCTWLLLVLLLSFSTIWTFFLGLSYCFGILFLPFLIALFSLSLALFGGEWIT